LFHANFAAKLSSLWAGRPWVIGGIRVAEREKRWHLTLERMTQRFSAGAVCVSEGVRRFSQETGGIAADRLVVIANGVDFQRFDIAEPVPRQALELMPDDRVALFVGRLTRQKGVATLLEAFSEIVDKRPDWRLVIAGDGPDRAALESQAATQGDRIRFLGRRDDVASLMKTADLLVLLSPWEGMPNVVLEAMAAGRAVCVTDVEGIAELVDQKSGWVAHTGDRRDLAAKLLDATADDAPRSQFGQRAREVVRSQFTQEAVVAAYERLWLSVLG